MIDRFKTRSTSKKPALLRMLEPDVISHIRRCLFTALCALTLYRADALAGQPQKIVAIGGSVTEIIYALDEQDRLVGRDTTSQYPKAALSLPDVGYIRRLSPEGVLSIDPDLILSLEGAGPPEAVSVLKQSGINIIEIPEGYDAAAVITKIKAVGDALGVPEKALALVQRVQPRLDALNKAREARTGNGPKPTVLFVLSMAGDNLLVAGRHTSAEGIITLAGGQNAITSFESYKAASLEAVLEAAPDVILLMKRGGDNDHGGTLEDIRAHPVLGQTPAAKNAKVLAMDGLYLLGFGPRTADAATDLSRFLYGNAPKADH